MSRAGEGEDNETVILAVPHHLVRDLAAAISMGCWTWSPERERPMLEIRAALINYLMRK